MYFQPLNVRVSFDGNPAVTVMLLDCDTITQAKSKILDVIFKVWKEMKAGKSYHVFERNIKIPLYAAYCYLIRNPSYWFFI